MEGWSNLDSTRDAVSWQNIDLLYEGYCMSYINGYLISTDIQNANKFLWMPGLALPPTRELTIPYQPEVF